MVLQSKSFLLLLNSPALLSSLLCSYSQIFQLLVDLCLNYVLGAAAGLQHRLLLLHDARHGGAGLRCRK
jgi:hypothetical protein